MRRSIARLKGLAYVTWHAKHMVFHVLLGLMWAWFLREMWGALNPKWIFTAVIGSILPDADHFLYFFTYGKGDPYTRTVVSFWKHKQWRILVTFLENGHKNNTSLTFHNVYSVLVLIITCAASFMYDWKIGILLSGSMVSHYVFDIAEDLVLLGKINPNWKRFGAPKKRLTVTLRRSR